MNHPNREAWLQAACAQLESILAQAGLTPASVKVSCGWPSRKALSVNHRRLGECWHEGSSQVFISPYLADPLRVVETLVHELIHAALPVKVGHRGAFVRAARALGLEGKPTATHAGEGLVSRLNTEILPVLGPYPHEALTATGRTKQGTRLRLYECPCPVKVRVASDVFEATCNVCQGDFQRVTHDVCLRV